MKESEIKHALEKIGWAFVGIKDLLLRRNDILLWQLEDIANKAENAYNHVTALCDYMIDDGEIDITEALENIRIEATKILTNKYGDVPDCIPETNERDPFYNRIFFNVGSIIWEISCYWNYVEKRKNTTPPAAGQISQEITSFKTDKSVKKLTDIFNSLQEHGFIAQTSLLNEWLAVFGKRPFPENFNHIIWTAKNKKTNNPEKSSLLNLLDIMGIDEYTIRSHINKLFKADGLKKFSSNDYNKYFIKNMGRSHQNTLQKLL